MKIQGAVVLVTGANRGLGAAFTTALLARGAKKVYAAARDPASVRMDGVVPVKLDVTQPGDIAALAAQCEDVTLLINNAGIARNTALLATDSVEAARAEIETNFFGPLNLAKAFVPILRTNGGGAILNILSVLSWISLPGVATYCVSKSAAWSMTNGLRNELREQGTQVVGLHVGLMDTDMASSTDAPKAKPADVVRKALDVIENGGEEVLADELSGQVKQGLSAGVYLQAASA